MTGYVSAAGWCPDCDRPVWSDETEVNDDGDLCHACGTPLILPTDEEEP